MNSFAFQSTKNTLVVFLILPFLVGCDSFERKIFTPDLNYVSENSHWYELPTKTMEHRKDGNFLTRSVSKLTGKRRIPSIHPVGNPQGKELVENSIKDLGLILADRLSCPIGVTGDRLKDSSIEWHFMDALAGWNNFMLAQLQNDQLKKEDLNFDPHLLYISMIGHMEARIWGFKKNTTPPVVALRSEEILNQLLLQMKQGNGVYFNDADSLRKHFKDNTLFKDLSSKVMVVADKYRPHVGDENKCEGFTNLGRERWDQPRFSSQGLAELVVRDYRQTRESLFAKVKGTGPEERKLASISQKDSRFLKRGYDWKEDVPRFHSEEQKETLEEIQEESVSLEPLGGYSSASKHIPVKRSDVPKEVNISEEAMAAGLMPGVPYERTLVGSGTKSRKLDPKRKHLIITHMTAGSGFKKTGAHFTIGRDGRVMQHGPITHQMRGAKGNNPHSIHVEFVAAYTRDAAGQQVVSLAQINRERRAKGLKAVAYMPAFDLSSSEGGGKGHHYQVMTPAQLETGARVYAFIAQKTGIPLQRLTDGKNPWAGGGAQVTGYRVGSTPKRSGVANHREANPMSIKTSSGKTIKPDAHHSDFMRESQLQQMLAMAQNILQEAKRNGNLVAMK